MEGGWVGYEPTYDADREMVVPFDDRIIKRRDIPKILSAENMRIIKVFFDCEMFGVLPYSGGWLDQPCNITVIWSMLKGEYNRRVNAKVQHGGSKRQGIRRHSSGH